jgi:rhamnosyltransferase
MASATRGVNLAAVWAVFHGQSVEASVISALLATVDQVVVVDNRVNASIPLQGMNELHGLSRYGNVKLLVNHNAGGLAGAYNRAVEWLGVAHPELDCVVFLDEDSDVAALQPFLQDDAVRELLAATSTAAVAPVPKDLATGLRSKRMQFVNPWRLRYLPRHCTRLQPVAFVINSMSVWRMQALRQLGPHDEGLAIDHVDTDYCLRARRAGLGKLRRVHVARLRSVALECGCPEGDIERLQILSSDAVARVPELQLLRRPPATSEHLVPVYVERVAAQVRTVEG